MVIDAHLHVWRAMLDYPDTGYTAVSPHSDVPVELLNEYMDEHGVDRAVIVQPMYPGEDNSYVADCAAAQPERFAAVCVVDPRLPGAEDRLEYWVRERGCKGLRLRPRFRPEEALFGDPSTFPLWERARTLGIAVNLLMNPEHLHATAALAERFPDVPIILDHMAHPNVRAGAQGLAPLLDLARYPRVFVKITGYYYYSQQRYPYADCHDLIRAVYDRYGAARLIWGTDFPHVLLKTGYRRARLMQERVYSFMRKDDLELIMGQNAVGLYWG